MAPPRPHDVEVAKFVAWLQKHNLEAHVRHINQPVSVIIVPRHPRKSRLTGETK